MRVELGGGKHFSSSNACMFTNDLRLRPQRRRLQTEYFFMAKQRKRIKFLVLTLSHPGAVL